MVAAMKAKYKSKMLFLREMLGKYLLLREFSFATPPLNLDATLIIHPGIDTLPKTTTKR